MSCLKSKLQRYLRKSILFTPFNRLVHGLNLEGFLQMQVKGDDRNKIGLEISKIYFGNEKKKFSRAAYGEALLRMNFLISDGPIKLGSDGKDITPQKYKYDLNDIEQIVDESISVIEHRQELADKDKQIYLDEFLENSLDGKKHPIKKIPVLPIPESELPGDILLSKEHYLQQIRFQDTTLYYLKNTLNRYFIQGLNCSTKTYQQDSLDDVIYTVVWGTAADADFTVGIIVEDELTSFILDADEVYEWNNLQKGVRLFLNSGTIINLKKVIAEALES